MEIQERLVLRVLRDQAGLWGLSDRLDHLVTLVRRVNLDNRVKLVPVVPKDSLEQMVNREIEERPVIPVQLGQRAALVIAVIQDHRDQMDNQDHLVRLVLKGPRDH
jgi:hypothetical protein